MTDYLSLRIYRGLNFNEFRTMFFFHISTSYALLLTSYFSRNQPQSINVGPLFVVNYIKDQNPRNGFRFIHP